MPLKLVNKTIKKYTSLIFLLINSTKEDLWKVKVASMQEI